MASAKSPSEACIRSQLVDPSRAISCALWRSPPKTTLVSFIALFRLLWENRIRARLLARFSLFLVLFLLLACERPSEQAAGCNGAAKGCGSFGRNRRSERSRPLPARGRLAWLWFFPSGSCFLFFSFFLALSWLTAFLFTPYLEERFSKGLFYLWEMYISFDFFPGFWNFRRVFRLVS